MQALPGRPQIAPFLCGIAAVIARGRLAEIVGIVSGAGKRGFEPTRGCAGNRCADDEVGRARIDHHLLVGRIGEAFLGGDEPRAEVNEIGACRDGTRHARTIGNRSTDTDHPVEELP